MTGAVIVTQEDVGRRGHGVERQIESLGDQQIQCSNPDTVPLLALKHAGGQEVAGVPDIRRSANTKVAEDEVVQGLDGSGSGQAGGDLGMRLLRNSSNRLAETHLIQRGRAQ